MTEGAPTGGTLPDDEVRSMFDRIAGFYDLMNQAMTAGLHHRWRARAADLADVGPGTHALDVATGTGDLAIELARRGADVIGGDFSDRMLDRARQKVAGWAPGTEPDSRVAPGQPASQAEGQVGSVAFVWADALELPYEDGAFDAATVGFGARNFGDLERGVAEMARVVRPGGKVVILEITTPVKPPLSTFFALWFDRIVPALGAAAGDSAAYAYLPTSVKRFPPPARLAAVMADAGMTRIHWIVTAGGIIALHVGEVR